jgi:hypothetical protein
MGSFALAAASQMAPAAASGAVTKRTHISSRRNAFMKSVVGVFSEYYQELAEERRADRPPSRLTARSILR